MSRSLKFVPLILIAFLILFNHATNADTGVIGSRPNQSDTRITTPNAQITVNTAALSPTPAGDPNDGKCDLREAMQAAFTANSNNQQTTFNECTASPGPTFIVFDPSIAGQTITIAPGDDILPFVNYDLTITGPIILSGGGLPPANPPATNYDSRMFRVAGGGNFTLMNLTMKNGFTVGSGGFILGDNNSTTNLVGVAALDNTAYSDGGFIDTTGNLNILASTFSNNRALGRNSNDYSNNPGTGFGGAIAISGPYQLNVSLSNFSGNTADKSGGAISMYQSSVATISDSAFSGNIANANLENPAGGGALYNYDSTVTVVRSPFNANVTPNGFGGAIFNNLSSDSFTIEDSSFNGNVSGDTNSNGRGGAIYTEEDMTITRSTFNANVVLGAGYGGAIANNRAAVLQLTNSTLLANVVVDGLNPAGFGGAIANIDDPYPVGSDSTVQLRNVTITENKAQTGGAIYNTESVMLWNTIIHEGTIGDGGTCAGDAPQNMGNNLQDPGTACGGSITSDDPDLGPPMFNGGALPTLISLMPEGGSPALDAGSTAVCEGPQVNNEDQRGVGRPKDGDGDQTSGCDIGAIEGDTAKAGFGSNPSAPGPLNFGNALPAAPTSVNLQIVETGNLPLTVSGSIGGANPANFSVSGLPLTINDGGDPVNLQLTCTPVNSTPGVRNATLNLTTNDPDKPLVTFNLTCNVPAVPTAGYASQPPAPGPLDFGEVIVGQNSPKTLVISETGNAALNLGPASLSGPHASDFLLGPLLASIPNGGPPTNFIVTCQPTATGLRTAVLTIATNDPARATVNYNLVCDGVPLPPPFLHVPGQAIQNGATAGANGPVGTAVSSDGQHIYLTDYGDDRLSLYRRTATNDLEYVTSWQNNVNGVAGMDGPWGVTISPDGRNVYVAGYLSSSVTTFTRDSATGLLTYLNFVEEGDGYGCFPAPCNGTISGLDGIWDLVVSPDGRQLYTASFGDGAVVVLGRSNTNGSLSSILTGALFVQSYTSAETAGARGIDISPDGLHLYVAAFTNDKLVAFNRSTVNGTIAYASTRTDGELISADPIAFLDGLDGATDVQVSPDGAHIYVTGYNDNSVAAFQRNALTGFATYLRDYDDDDGSGNGLLGAFNLDMSADGRYLFATGMNDNALTVFFRLTGSGALNQIQTITQADLSSARGVVAIPDGSAAAVASWNTNKLVYYRVSNPAPIISTLLPASAAGGSAGFNLTIQGENFLPYSQAAWNGVNRTTTYISLTELQIAVTAADLPTNNAITSADVSVTNPVPGGGTAETTFTITHANQNPVPAIASLEPQSIGAGSSGFTLAVRGSGFMNSSTVQWNGVNRSTTYVNSGELRIDLTATDLLNAGTAVLTVVNPGPGGGTSNGAPFDIAAPGQNPAPTITGLSPDYAVAFGPASTSVDVLLSGVNFLPGAQAEWNGSPRPTAVISETELRITLLASDISSGASGGIRVVNPEPGGGPSNTVTFTIYAYGIYVPMVIR
jgi:6-phosphogluconolactonase (cycloisomerase 2 family)